MKRLVIVQFHVAIRAVGGAGSQVTINASVDLTPLEAAFAEWLKSSPRKLELAAATRDVECLLHQAPPNPCGLRRPSLPSALLVDVQALHGLLLGSIFKNLRSLAYNPLIISPYAGGMAAGDGQEGDETLPCRKQVDKIKVGTWNPVRSGLAALGSSELLHWRLHAIGATLHSQDIKVCALPGARFPPGSKLPANFKYSWLGVQTVSRASVGILLHSSIEDSIILLEDVGSNRIMWLF